MKRILYAEDDAGEREAQITTLRILFEDHGIYDVEFDETDNGQSLVDMVLNGNYDLVLTDHIMPRLTGLEAIKRIRERSRKSQYI
jgi:CheY-like chemotaxis protein